MRNRITKGKWFSLFAAAILVAASVISVVVLSAKRKQPNTQQRKEWLTSIPPVRSKVKDLEIINERIVRPNTDISGVAFEILNKSNRAVMAVRITCGNAGISKDGLDDEDHPTVIIEPYGTLSADMTELIAGAPIVISSATFQDAKEAKEEGDKSSLEFMQNLRARHKAEKEKQSTGRGPNK